ncbi:MAG: hypothetical protein CBARDCOR_2210 [uncultured Caballeronia sp.]|nr:MAG: hypothetical protein CBARDCOR_2210 [uncultured Caballeronia sp.]
MTQFGSVQHAADSLSITQPAVSKTIGELESILDVRLFVAAGAPRRRAKADCLRRTLQPAWGLCGRGG